MGSFPHELPGYRHVSDDTVRHMFEDALGRDRSTQSRGCVSRTCSTAPSRGPSRPSMCRARTSPSPTRTPTTCRRRSASLELCVVQDLFLNETAKFAHVFLPGNVVPRKGRDLHQRRAAHQPGQACHGAAQRQAGVGGRLRARHRDGLPDALRDREPRSWTRSRARRRHSPGVSFAKLDARRQRAVALQRRRALRYADHAHRQVRPRQGPLRRDPVRPDRRDGPTAAIRSFSRPGASFPSTTSEHRREGPRTSPGIRRTCSRSTLTTPKSAASSKAAG